MLKFVVKNKRRYRSVREDKQCAAAYQHRGINFFLYSSRSEKIAAEHKTLDRHNRYYRAVNKAGDNGNFEVDFKNNPNQNKGSHYGANRCNFTAC